MTRPPATAGEERNTSKGSGISSVRGCAPWMPGAVKRLSPSVRKDQTDLPVATSSPWMSPSRLLKMTRPSATAGEEEMAPAAWKRHFSAPLFASRAYKRWSALPTNRTPSETTGDESTLAPVRKVQAVLARVGGAEA